MKHTLDHQTSFYFKLEFSLFKILYLFVTDNNISSAEKFFNIDIGAGNDLLQPRELGLPQGKIVSMTV